MFRVTWRDMSRTLTNEEVNGKHEKVLERALVHGGDLRVVTLIFKSAPFDSMETMGVQYVSMVLCNHPVSMVLIIQDGFLVVLEVFIIKYVLFRFPPTMFWRTNQMWKGFFAKPGR